jgi:hypothetical protein
MEWIDPDLVIFVSKDGLDAAVSSLANLFFCIKKQVSKKDLSAQDRDFILWILYGPVLMIRERALHKQEALRTEHFLQTFEQGCEKNSANWQKMSKEMKEFILDVDVF